MQNTTTRRIVPMNPYVSGFLTGAVLLVAGSMVALLQLELGPPLKACHSAVEALMHSHDAVEVERAGFIVLRLRCPLPPE